jgi:TolB-like protein/tetratricopeptide (TPR) repeat protein
MPELSHPTGAVFLSYASQDSEAATRICEALQAAGVEVWLDKSELRGGDAWDAQIKKHIHDCALFIPVISAHTNARSEGYFRGEWHLATRRLHNMADDATFLVPVVVDETHEADARVPEEFFRAQWTWLPGGETPPAFAQRVRHLLGGDSETHAEQSTAIAQVEPSVRVGHARNRRAPPARFVVPALITLLVLAAAAFWYSEGTGDAPSANPAPPAGSPIAAAAPNEKSIAVLPFVNMSPDKEQDYFADGIAEELLNLLAQVPQLRVIARTSSFSFKGKQVEISEIARRLNVAHVLEGSVRKSGDTLRVTVQLVRTADSSHLWSHTYDRQMTDVFKVQDEIAAAVVSELKIKLLTATPKAKTTDAKAYALYLRAPKPNTYGIKSIEQAIVIYKQVLAIDPSYAPAWDGLADAYYSQMDAGLSTSAQALPLARDAVNQALTNDPQYAPAYARAAAIEGAIVGHLAAAARYLEKGLALDPYNLDLIDAAVKISRRMGRLDQSLALAEYAAGRDPVSMSAHESLAWAYVLTGRLDEAITEFRTALALKPDADVFHESLGEVLLEKGDPRAALAEMQQEPFELQRLVGLSMAYHALGQKAESDSALDDLIQKGEKTMPYFISYVLAFRGETNRTFQWLEKAIEYGDPYVSWTSIDPKFKVLHKDPRWLPLLRRLGQAPEQLAAIHLDVRVPN